MKIIYVSLLFISWFCFISCCTNRPLQVEIDPTEKNPVEYVFPFSKGVIEDAIVKSFTGGKRYGNNETIYIGKETYPSDSLLWDTKNHNYQTDNTLFLFSVRWPSKVYFRKDGYPYTYVPYRIQFHIDPIGEDLTKVWIEVVKPQVVIRHSLVPLPHAGLVLKEVPATTVEEYEILQILGRTLGVKDMPEIKIPKKIVF